MSRSRTKRRMENIDSQTPKVIPTAKTTKLPKKLEHIASAPPQRWLHGSEYEVGPVDAGDVQAWSVQKVCRAVDGLRRSGRILDNEVFAAARWVADYERSLRSSYVDSATAGIRGSGGANSGPELKWLGGISAATRLSQVRAALGRDAEALLVLHVHFATSFRAATTSGSARTKAANRLTETLKDLAVHYAECDRQSFDGVLRPAKHVEQGMAA